MPPLPPSFVRTGTALLVAAHCRPSSFLNRSLQQRSLSRTPMLRNLEKWTGGRSNQLKEAVDKMWSKVDHKLAELGVNSGYGGSHDADMLRYLITALLVMWILYFVSPPGGKMFFLRNFSLTRDNVGRVYPLATSLLLNLDFFNLLFSCFLVYSLGPAMITQLGRRQFWQLFIGGGVAANCFYIFHQKAVAKGWMPTMSWQCGTISCGSALITTHCLLNPNSVIMVFVFPVRALYLAYGLLAFDSVRALSSLTTGAETGAMHTGGALYGALFWKFVLGGRLPF